MFKVLRLSVDIKKMTVVSDVLLDKIHVDVGLKLALPNCEYHINGEKHDKYFFVLYT